MGTMNQTLGQSTDGRPILTGAATLPPMNPVEIASDRAAKASPDKPKRKTADRFRTLNEFVDSSMGELSRSEIAVWMVLYRDTRNGTVRTSQANVSRRAGMSVRAVKTATRKLIGLGLLRVVYQGGLNRGPSRYQVNALGKRAS